MLKKSNLSYADLPTVDISKMVNQQVTGGRKVDKTIKMKTIGELEEQYEKFKFSKEKRNNDSYANRGNRLAKKLPCYQGESFLGRVHGLRYDEI